jgi:hypothetical protein
MDHVTIDSIQEGAVGFQTLSVRDRAIGCEDECRHRAFDHVPALRFGRVPMGREIGIAALEDDHRVKRRLRSFVKAQAHVLSRI